MLKNFLPVLVSQLLYNGKSATGELKFEECISKGFFKDQLQNTGIMSHLVTILKHDCSVITRELSSLFKKMNLIPALTVCLVRLFLFLLNVKASDYVQQSPHFEDLFMRIRNLFVIILGAKGGACFVTKHSEQIKVFLNVLEHLQLDLKTLEHSDRVLAKIYQEDNILGIFDYGEDFEMNILKSVSEKMKDQKLNVKRVRLGLFAKQLSTTIKYIVHATNCIDKICVKKIAENYDEGLIQNLSQISHISAKNRISNHALRSVLINDFMMQIFTSIMQAKTPDEVSFKTAEIALISEILYYGNISTIKILISSLLK